MSLAEERVIKMNEKYVVNLLKIELAIQFEDPASVPNSKRAVEAAFLRMEKQLAKDPEWRSAYSSLVVD